MPQMSMTRVVANAASLSLFLVVASSAFTLAQASEQAIVMPFKSKDVKWGGCPDFLPKACGLAPLHGDIAKPNSDIFFKVPGGGKIARHWHTSAERMILVSGRLQLTYDGQPAQVAKVGDYLYGPAKLPHSGVCLSKEPCILFIAFEEAVDAVPNK